MKPIHFIKIFTFLLIFSFACSQIKEEAQSVKFAVCTDVHKDIMYDADERLQTFIDRATSEKVDFVIQLGDFCIPKAGNMSFLSIFNSFKGDKYHVLGNHDLDSGYTRSDNLRFWDQSDSYYSFNKNNFHFIVLDGNDTTSPPQKGYAHYVGEEQIEWLRNDLEKTDLPTIVFSHQSLFDLFGTENDSIIRRIFEEENLKAGKNKIIACFNGHTHVDNYKKIGGIWYFELNSMSYYWLGKDFAHSSYDEQIEHDYPNIKYTAAYKEALFAIVTISKTGKIIIKGRKTEWVGPSPKELYFYRPGYDGMVKPEISDF